MTSHILFLFYNAAFLYSDAAGAAPPLITKKVVLIWIFCTVLWQTVIFYIFCTIFKWFSRPLNSDLEQTYLNNFDRESSQLFKSVRTLKIGGDLAIQYIGLGHPIVYISKNILTYNIAAKIEEKQAMHKL